MAIFDTTKAIGFFVGLTEGGLEFGAELTLRYDRAYQSLPMLGQFVIVELERPEEAVLGRITAISSHGRLASTAGEDVGAHAVDSGRPMPEDIRQQFLRYRCSVRLLGLLREIEGNEIIFAPSHRRLPHMGARVAFAEGKILQTVSGAKRPGSPIGFLAFGEFVYGQGDIRASHLTKHFQVISPIVTPNFDASSMVARRTCVFARAGFGKSNLLKTLFAKLYETDPMIDRRGTDIPVGTLVFDPDGEYFWPGSGKDSPPGLCDIEILKDKIVLITDRSHPEPYYESFKVARPKIDLRELTPSLLLPCVLENERISQRGSESLIRMPQENWASLVDLIWAYLNGSIQSIDDHIIRSLCRITGSSADVVAGGIRNTMLDVVQMLHDPASHLLRAIKESLGNGKLVIVDLSLMRGRPATSLTAVILKWLFEYNVSENTKPNSKAIPVIALIEEAQKVLESSNTSHAPFIDWVKEGRKFDLGAVLVTQQPGAIDHEIVSQSDNLFVFHLISGKDLNALKVANGHLSEDILATLLNEPIEGQGIFYTSTSPKLTYPIPFRAFNFGDAYQRLDKNITQTTPDIYAKQIVKNYPLKPEPDLSNLPTDPTNAVPYPNRSEITKPMQELAQKIMLDNEIKKDLDKKQFPKFLIEAWLKKAGKKRDITKLTNGIITIFLGLYGYGWKEESTVSQAGKTYIRISVIDKADGLKRLENDEDPLVEEEQEETGSIENN